MAQPDNNTQLSSAFKTFFERETLTGANFNDWYRSLRIVLRAVEFYDLVDALHSCKQAPRISVSAHVLEMKGYMDQLHAVGKSYDNDMAINLINRDLKRKENCLMVNNICKWAMEHKQQLKL
nr:hypothetical protein [Tanacetum cinerariifolium]